MSGPAVDILMYHSISDGDGPTSIAPGVFRAQIAALVDSGLPVISLDQMLRMRRGEIPAPPRAVVVTFDDGFQDFADIAWPVLSAAGLPAINYLPTAHVGGVDAWEDPQRPRPIMGWDTIRALAAEGAGFGSHAATHPRLDRLPADAVRAELVEARGRIAAELGAPPAHFAPPYGAAPPGVRAEIARLHETSVGTRLARSGPADDVHDLPRIEMFYFRDLAWWRSYLAGRGEARMALRRLLRAVRAGLRRGG